MGVEVKRETSDLDQEFRRKLERGAKVLVGKMVVNKREYESKLASDDSALMVAAI